MVETQELSVEACSHLMAIGKQSGRRPLKPGGMIVEPPPVRIGFLYKALRILLKPERMLLKPLDTSLFSSLQQFLLLCKVRKVGKHISHVFWDTNRGVDWFYRTRFPVINWELVKERLSPANVIILNCSIQVGNKTIGSKLLVLNNHLSAVAI